MQAQRPSGLSAKPPWLACWAVMPKRQSRISASLPPSWMLLLPRACALGGVALDCGAGVGRMAAGLLAPRFASVDLAEPDAALLREARRRHEGSPWARHFMQVPLQSLELETKRYAVVWVQWVLLYLTDADLRSFLRHASTALVRDGGGAILVKENVLLGESRGAATRRVAERGTATRRVAEPYASGHDVRLDIAADMARLLRVT